MLGNCNQKTNTMELVPNKNARIVDGLAGMPIEDTKRIEELKNELFDAEGNIIQAKGFEDYNSKVNKQIEFSLLMQKRNNLWLAKMN